jgi:hypothetical protein
MEVKPFVNLIIDFKEARKLFIEILSMFCCFYVTGKYYSAFGCYDAYSDH